MSLSSLPPYPHPSREWQQGAEGDTDWGLLRIRLLVIVVVGLLLAAPLCGLGILLTAGQVPGWFVPVAALGVVLAVAVAAVR